MTYEQAQEAAQYISRQWAHQPLAGIILGTGLGVLADAVEVEATIPYADIPHFPVSTAPSHKGRLLCGRLGGVPVLVMQGRFHYYEGYSLAEVTFPVRVMKLLGASILVASNACGSVHPEHEIGDIVVLRDHINLLPDNPLRGPNDERFGPRFPDMSEPYDRTLIEKAVAAAKKQGVRVHTGVYAVVSGPNLETPAEYVYLHRIGADLVGMSTVPEVIVARHMGMRTLALSVVTDRGYPPEVIREVTVEDVIEAASSAGKAMAGVVQEVLAGLH